MRQLAMASTWLAIVIAANPFACADDAGLPSGPFDPAHYHVLWETSPFAVASPVAVESVQYALVGAAQFDGVSYASVVDKGSQEHFVVTNKEASHGLTLLTLVHGAGTNGTYATLQSNGGILRLNLDSTTLPSPSPQPQVLNSAPTPSPTLTIPRVHPRIRSPRIFRPPIYVPQPPASTSP